MMKNEYGQYLTRLVRDIQEGKNLMRVLITGCNGQVGSCL